MQEQLTRRMRVLDYIDRHTRKALESGLPLETIGMDAESVSEALDLERANASRELNALYYNSTLIKLLGRPVRYISLKSIRHFYPDVFIPSAIPVGKTLSDYVKATPKREARTIPTNFQQAFSLGTSLLEASRLVDAAFAYSPHGLHILLSGSPSVNKLPFAMQIFAYGKQLGRFTAAQPIVFSCEDYNDASSAEYQLFGCAKGVRQGAESARKSLFEQAASGVVLIRGIQNLPAACLSRLLAALTQNAYSRIGDNTHPRPIDCMVIATCDETNAASAAQIARHFPIRISFPSVGERSMRELLSAVLNCLQEEAKLMQRELHVAKHVLYWLTAFLCTADDAGLQIAVKQLCIAALLQDGHAMGSHTPLSLRSTDLLALPDTAQSLEPEPARQLALQEQLQLLPADPVIISQTVPVSLPEHPLAPETSPAPKKPVEKHSVNETIAQNLLESFLRLSYQNRCVTGIAANANIARNTSNLLDQLRSLSIDPLLLHCTIDTLYQKIVGGFREFRLRPQRNAAEQLLLAQPEFEIAKSIFAQIHSAANSAYSNDAVRLTAMLLSVMKHWPLPQNLCIVLAFHGKGVSEGIVDYLHCHCSLNLRALSFLPDTTVQELNDQIAEIVTALPPNVTRILVFSDAAPLDSIAQVFRDRTGCKTFGWNNCTFNTLLECVNKISNFCYTAEMVYQDLHDSVPSASNPERNVPTLPSCSHFIQRIVASAIAPSLVFLDLDKAIQSLLTAFKRICDRMAIPYSDELCARFLLHCAPMLERAITRNTLHYYGLKKLISTCPALFSVTEEEFIPVARRFGISLPVNELAYVAELLSFALRE